MRRSETALVLTKIAAVDNRRLDDPNGADTPILDAWHELIGDLRVQDCIEAVKLHRKQSTDWIQPAHVRVLVEGIRKARVKDINDGDLTPDVDPFGPIETYVGTYQARYAAVRDGMPKAQAIATIPQVKMIEAAR